MLATVFSPVSDGKIITKFILVSNRVDASAERQAEQDIPSEDYRGACPCKATTDTARIFRRLHFPRRLGGSNVITLDK